MEQYKLLNAELMEQVQKQRILLGEMTRTEVLLKKQLLEEREMRLVDAQYNENKLKCAISTLLQSLDIKLDSSIDPPFSARTSQLSSEANKQSIYSREEVCSELRRSSALLRRTLVSSPSRKSRSQSTSSADTCNNSLVELIEDADEEEVEKKADEKEYTIPSTDEEVRTRKTPEPRRLADMHSNMSSPDTPEAEEPVAASLPDHLRTGASSLYSIFEECDSTLSSPISLDDETDTEIGSMEAASLALRDVTNRTTLHSSSPKTCSISRIEENDIENRSQELRHSLSITTTRGKRTRVPVNYQEQSSIERVRCAPQHPSPLHLTVPHCSMDSVATLTPSRSQLNFSSFNGIASRPDDFSTPQRNEDVNTKNKPATRKKLKPRPSQSTADCKPETEEEPARNSSVLSRPSRSCRPKSLKEVSCKTKMRNDSFGK